MEDVAGFWRFARSVRVRERQRLLFFTGVAALVALGQTLGLAGAEALFLTRYGVEYLPQTFIFASGVTVAGMLFYAGLVGSTRNDNMFSSMLWMASLLLAMGAYAAYQGSVRVLPVLFAGYFLTQAIFLNHFWTFASDYFDTLAAKRLGHLFTFGASAGGALGGALVVGISSVVPPEALIGAWAAVLATTGVVIRLGRRKLMRWGLLKLIEKDETSLEGLASAGRFARTNPLGYWLVASAAAMTMALFVSQYLYSGIFAAAFPETSDLALFLGVFLMLSNLGEIVITFAVTPWLTRHLGVGQANLIHPILTVLSYIPLAFDPRLYAGVLARVNREVLDDALATTLRQLTYNAISERLRARMRALVEGIVGYTMMALAGGLILLGLDPLWLCGVGGGMGLIYLFANLRIRNEYLRTLIGGIREGRIDVAQISEQLAAWEVPRLVELWDSLTEPGTTRLGSSAAPLARVLAARGVYAPLVRSATGAEARVRCACIDALAGSAKGVPEAALMAALADVDSDVRRAAVRAIATGNDDVSQSSLANESAPSQSIAALATRPLASFDPQLRQLLQDEIPEVRADAAATLGKPGAEVLLKMASSSDADEAVAALQRLPCELADAALERVDSSKPRVRAAALEAVARLVPAVSIGRDRLARNLDHPNAAVRSAATTALAVKTAESTEAVETVAGVLADPSRIVRARAVEALRSVGEIGRQSAIPYLKSHSQGTVEAAIEILSDPTSSQTRKLFRSELRSRVRQAWGDMLALASLPNQGEISIRFLRAAHEDSMRRNHAVAFALLRGLEDPAVVRSVERALRFAAPRTRAAALEVLSNLGDRDSANLLVLMIEDSSTTEKTQILQSLGTMHDDLERALEAEQRVFDVWIRMGRDYHRKNGGGNVSQEDTMERLLLLRKIPLFSRLNLDQLEAINLQMTESHYLRGEIVMREGEPGGELFLLLDGQTRAVSGYGTPDEMTLNVQHAPDYFGEMAILDDRPRSATIVVTAEARVLSLGGESFQDLMFQLPEISFEICRSLSSRLRGLEAEHHHGPEQPMPGK
jgi:HEAT repeat protein